MGVGGNVAYFTVKRSDIKGQGSVELLACGQGQYGALGNGGFSSAQGVPKRIKQASGLIECNHLIRFSLPLAYSHTFNTADNEKTGQKQPVGIHSVSISSTGHALVTVDTVGLRGPGGIRGRDLLVCGQNREYELGNGRRTNRATPVQLSGPEGLPFMMLEKEATVKDMGGKAWKRKATVYQTAVAGYNSSLAFWKIDP